MGQVWRKKFYNKIKILITNSQETFNRSFNFQILYWREDPSDRQIRTVAASETQTSLQNLTMFTEYSLVILAFNAAGDGPLTKVPLRIRTLEGG